MKSAVQQMGKIIDGFQERGYFQAKIIEDKPYYSTEVAFFVNRVVGYCKYYKEEASKPK